VSSVTSNFAKWIGRLKPCDYGRTGYSSNTKPNTKTRPMKFDREMSVTHSSFALSSTVSHLIVTQTFLKHARTSSFFSQHRANGAYQPGRQGCSSSQILGWMGYHSTVLRKT